MGSRGLGGSDHRPEILRILHAVEDQEERRLSTLPGAFEKVLQLYEYLYGRQGPDPLMGDPPAERIQPPGIYHLHGNLSCPRLPQNLVQGTSQMGGSRHENAGDRPAGSKRFQDCAPAEERGLARGNGVAGRGTAGRGQRTRHLYPV